MLIIFSVNDQKITHDLKGQLVAGSVDIVQAAFKFDSSWDELDKIVVFTSSACPKPVPVQFADEAFYIPKDVLKPGKLYVSVVGFGLDGRKKTTQKWDIMQAITVQNCGDGGDCDLLRYLAQGQVADGKVAKDNLGADSSPVVAIAAGTKTKDTAAYTPFRNVFYGASDSKPALDSAAIRALGKTGKAYAAGTLTINVPVGAQRVAIACIATAKGVIKDINDSLKTCEAHVQSAHAPANAEENVIVSIQRNGQAIPPDNKVVNIEVPTKTSALENDSGYATTEDVVEKVNGAGHLKAVHVDALPAPSEANADTIYFLRKNNSEAGKQYRAYKLIHGIFEIVGSAEVDLTSYATRESVAKADDGLIKGIYNNMTASSEKYLGSGNLLLFWTLLKSLLNGHESSINDLLARVKLLELILSADVTGNPYYVTFNTLTDVVVSSGIWNESDGRIEF